MPSPAQAFRELLADVKTEVDARLELALQKELQLERTCGREVSESLQAARQLCAGGKRLRAALVMVGKSCFKTETAATRHVALECGVALEMLQAYFLIHDDWMDQDNTRRGVPAVHSVLSERFESVHKGAAAAVLAGDYLVALATRHLVGATKRHPALAALLECFAEMQLDAVAGQQLDVVGLSRKAERVYQLKTASYTVRGPLQLGALLAGATPAQALKLDRFAQPLGIAFQIRDDLLGAFSPPEVTGKPQGNDLLQGKWTWLVEHALSHGSAAEQKAISLALGNAKATKRQLDAATAALIDSGARQACETRITDLQAQAERALASLQITSKGRVLLSGSVSALLARSS